MSEDKKWNKFPNGGFPNLFKNAESSEQEISLSSKRAFAQNPPNIVNVKDILLKQRHLLNPFIPNNIDE